MAWVRLDDSAMSNLKIQRISDSAFRLWMKGLCYCQMHLTDGLIPREALGPMEAKRRDVDALCTPQVEGRAALWSRIDAFGFKVHNYLKYNDSREEVEAKREQSKGRMQKSRARRFSEVAPVVAPQPLEKLRESPHANTPLSLLSTSGSSFPEKRKSDAVVPDEIAERAARFVERYEVLYSEKRKGAKYLRRQPALDWDRACKLCRTWDDARLEKMAVIFLTTDDEWISGTDRGFPVFESRASWCDEKLAAWEAKRKPA